MLSYRSHITFYHQFDESNSSAFFSQTGSVQRAYHSQEESTYTISTYLVAKAQPVLFIDLQNSGSYTPVVSRNDLLENVGRENRRMVRRFLARNRLSFECVEDIASIAEFLTNEVIVPPLITEQSDTSDTAAR